MFIGRRSELSQLNQWYKEDAFFSMAVHGRSRVGKSALINEFCRDKRTISFVAAETTLKNNLSCLRDRIFALKAPNPDENYDTLDALLNHLCDYAKKEKTILFIDDYPLLSGSDQEVASIFYQFMDGAFKDTKLFLILCGTTNGFNRALTDKDSLKERIRCELKIQPFDYYETARFFPRLTPTDKALIYGVTGGMPYYLRKYDASMNVKDNLANLFFDQTGIMFQEPQYLLKQTLREAYVYNAILEAVAKGAIRLNEIAAALGAETSVCSTYLKPLIAQGFIEKVTPLFADKSKKTVYRITDPMLLFWYRYIPSHLTAIISGHGQEVFNTQVWPTITDYLAIIFERIAIQYLIRRNNRKELPFYFTEIGRWWGTNAKKPVQFEIAATDQDGRLLLGRCRYTREHTSMEAVDRLREDSLAVKGFNEIYYTLFSKSGFTRQLLENKQDIHLTDMNELYV